MIELKTSRFGTLNVEEQTIIDFPEGLLGFPTLHRFILMDYKDTTLKWLQCVDDPDIAFIVVPPQDFIKKFEIVIDDVTRGAIKLQSDDDLGVLVILRVENDEVIANMDGPLAINSRHRIGVQALANK